MSWKKMPGHKYIARIQKGNTYQYFYTMAEYKAALNPKSAMDKARSVATSASKTTRSIQKNASNAINTAQRTANTVATNTVNSIPSPNQTETFNGTKNNNKDFKYLFKQKVGDYMRYFYSNKELQAFVHSTKSLANSLSDFVQDHIPGNKHSTKEREAEKVKNKGKKAIENLNIFTKTDASMTTDMNDDMSKKKPEDENANTTSARDADQEAINPHYDPTNKTYAYNNCAYCTLAYDFRRRGYDVEAEGVDETVCNDPQEIESWYEGGKLDGPYQCTASDADNYAKYLQQYGDGAYGQFCVYWSTGGGHSMVWSNEGGRTIIRDCQSNKAYYLEDWIKGYDGYVTGCYMMRTDNLKMTDRASQGVHKRGGKSNGKGKY